MQATSRRATAAEVGISPRGLLKLLAGAEPRRVTLQKLETWYREGPRQAPVADRELMIDGLLEQIPEPHKANARLELVAALDAICLRYRSDPT